MVAFPRAVVPFEVSALEIPGPLISKAQSGRVNFRSTQQIGRTWTEHYLVNTRSVNGRALLAFVDNVWRNGTTFTIDHRDHVTPLGTGGGSPLVQAATQLHTNPENFGAWTPSGTPVRTGGQSDPLGGTAAYLLGDDSGVAAEYVTEVVTFTGSAAKSMALYVKGDTATTSVYQLFDSTAVLDRLKVTITWSAGVPSPVASVGTAFLAESVPTFPTWYRIPVQTTTVTPGNTNTVAIYPAGETVGNTGNIYVFGANAWNELTPARYAGPSQVAGTTGSSLYLNGGTASVSNWLRAGDLITLANVAASYEVTADVSTQANGYVVVPINPPIFTGGGPADNAAVTITGVTLTACILEPPTYPTTSGTSADYGELVVKFSESLT